MTVHSESRLVLQLNVSGWAVLLVTLIASLLFLSLEVTIGVVAGGIMVVINLALLQRAVTRALALGRRTHPFAVLPWFYLFFALTALTSWVLIAKHLVDPLGLLLGLSVFIWSVFIVVIQV